MLQMLRSIGDGQANPRGKSFDAARPLCQLLDQLHTVRVAERFGYLSERGTDGTGGSAA